MLRNKILDRPSRGASTACRWRFPLPQALDRRGAVHLRGMADDVSDRVKKPMSPAAARALAEAAARRAERERAASKPPEEVQGRGGLDPVRYGDWEVNGIASDF